MRRVPKSLCPILAAPTSERGDLPELSQCGWQELPVYERLERVAKCISGVNGRIESRFAQLDSADESNRARRCSICKREVRMLIALSDERAEITNRKAVFVDDPRPHIGVIANVLCNAHRLVCSDFHAQRL